MSVRMGLLALLAERPQHGYQLKTAFESRTGGAWALNIGQVYTTLQRLERDGLIREVAAEGETRIYDLTPEGAYQATAWWTEPVERQAAPRDELVVKVAFALSAPGVDARLVIQAQREASMQVLRDLTRGLSPSKVSFPTATQQLEHIAAEAAIESHRFAVEAELRWLDHLDDVVLPRLKTLLTSTQNGHAK